MQFSTVHPNAKIAANVDISPYCYIAEHVEIGEGLGIERPSSSSASIHPEAASTTESSRSSIESASVITPGRSGTTAE